tara:strand:- start:741 stop:1781 length:1041 start_codon:yes stop_codon:yes gene_type:complete
MFRRRPNTSKAPNAPNAHKTPQLKESIAVQGGNGIIKYWIHMPTNYIELLLFINVNSYFKITSPNLQKLIVYDKDIQNPKTRDKNIFTTYNLIKYNTIQNSTFSDDLEYIKKRYSLIHIFDLFLKINTLKLNINNIFDRYFVTAQAMTKSYLKKKLNNKSVILMHISPTSMTNDVFFILALRTILKLEYIKECSEIDPKDPNLMKECSNIANIENDCMILIYSDCQENNSLYVKQFIHKLCTGLPFFKNIVHDGNKYIEELINNNKSKLEIPRNILYNISAYVIIDNDEYVMFSLATMMNNTSTFLFANKFIRPSIAEIIRLKIGQIDYNNCTTLEEIEDKRFVAI